MAAVTSTQKKWPFRRKGRAGKRFVVQASGGFELAHREVSFQSVSRPTPSIRAILVNHPANIPREGRRLNFFLTDFPQVHALFDVRMTPLRRSACHSSTA
jgi:hypothetical protein